MRALRVVLIGVPPLLADIIRRPVAARLEAHGIMLSISGAAEAAAAPDVLIIREGVRALAPKWPARMPAVLTLSDDLALISGPAPGEATALTPDSLAGALLRTI